MSDMKANLIVIFGIAGIIAIATVELEGGLRFSLQDLIGWLM